MSRSCVCSRGKASAPTSRRAASWSSRLRADVPGARIVFHGNNKSDDELRAAAAARSARRARLARGGRTCPRRPASRRCSSGSRRGSKPTRTAAIRTAHAESKFGLDPADAVAAVAAGIDAGLDVAGLHVHIGSQLTGSAQSLQAVTRLAEVAQRCHAELGWTPRLFDLGGGLGVRTRSPNPCPSRKHSRASCSLSCASAGRGRNPCRCCSNRAARSSAPRASRSIESAASSAAAASPMPPWTAACPTIRARSSTARATKRCSRIAPTRRRRARSGSRASTASPATC